jgi:(2R)-ethylmalonyl-CoA mutase
VPEVLRLLGSEGVDAPVVVGGIIPEDDQATLLGLGVRAVYTPKDFELGRIMDDISTIAEEHRGDRAVSR